MRDVDDLDSDSESGFSTQVGHSFLDMFNSDPCNQGCFIIQCVCISCTALEFFNGAGLHLNLISVSPGGP